MVLIVTCNLIFRLVLNVNDNGLQNAYAFETAKLIEFVDGSSSWMV